MVEENSKTLKNLVDPDVSMSYDETRANEIVSRYNPEDLDVEFVRDADTLWRDYRALRISTKKRLMRELNTSDAEELDSYINDAFVSLIKEYQPNSGVDLPGYLKSMLYTRAKYLFVRPIQERYKRESLVEKDDVLAIMEQNFMNETGKVGGGSEDESAGYTEGTTDIASNFIGYLDGIYHYLYFEKIVLEMLSNKAPAQAIYQRVMISTSMSKSEAVKNVRKLQGHMQTHVAEFLAHNHHI